MDTGCLWTGDAGLERQTTCTEGNGRLSRENWQPEISCDRDLAPREPLSDDGPVLAG